MGWDELPVIALGGRSGRHSCRGLSVIFMSPIRVQTERPCQNVCRIFRLAIAFSNWLAIAFSNWPRPLTPQAIKNIEITSCVLNWCSSQPAEKTAEERGKMGLRRRGRYPAHSVSAFEITRVSCTRRGGEKVPGCETGGGKAVRPGTFSSLSTQTGKRIVRVGIGVPAAEPFVVRTLWCRGAPTRTCCGAIQGVKLRGQCRTACQPRGGSWLGETWKVEEREDPLQGSSLRSGQRG